MDDLDNNTLLAQYARAGSEEAFAALVARHVNLVYSVALRHVADPHQAEEITQAVFLLLAKKAGSLSPKVILSGWLYRAAQLTAANYMRMERRRKSREQEAHMQSVMNESTPDVWAQIAPVLEAAMERLGERERDAVVLRFFEGKSLKEVGDALGASDAAAQKSVERALKKLRDFFTRRGITLSAEILTSSLSIHSVQAAPAGLAESVATMGLAKGAAASGPALALMQSTLKTMTWLKIKTVVVAGALALVIVGVAAVTVVKIEKTSAGSIHASEPLSAKVEASPPSAVSAAVQGTPPSALNKQVSAEPVEPKQNDQLNVVAGKPDEEKSPAQPASSNSQDATDYLKQGRAYLSQGEYDQAIADFNQALQIDPNLAAAYFSRGRANKLKGNNEQATADYTQAIQLNPQLVAAYVNRGQLDNMAKRYDEAIGDFDHAIALDANRPIPYLDRGVAHGAKGDYAKARDDFNSTIALDPNFSPAYNNLAWLLATCPQAAFRDGKKAVENATKACDLSQGGNLSQIDTLAAAYAEAGDFENAVKWESKILETPDLTPEDAAIAQTRLELYQAHQPYHRQEITPSPNNP